MKDFLEWTKPGSEEARLASLLDPSAFPRHIAVIMDGNGRWARKRHLPRVAGHRAGVKSVREIIEASCRLQIRALTLYAFSMENWKRPQAEVETLWGLLQHYLHRELPELKRNGVRMQVIGRIDGLPASVQDDLDMAMVETAANSGLQLTIALNYGGRAEIVDAVNSLLARARKLDGLFKINEQILSEHLYTAGLPDPDLLIRTSGEMRVSNFLLWQIAYAEIFVTDKFWPDFCTMDLLEALLDYQKRERRYGGLSDSTQAPEPESELVAVNGAESTGDAAAGDRPSSSLHP